MGTAHGGRAQICTGGMEEPGKQYPYEKPGGLEPGRIKPIEEPGAEEKDPVVFTGLETVWVTVDKVGLTTNTKGWAQTHLKNNLYPLY